MNYYLGIDIGTSSSKAVAFSENGEVMANFSFAYKMRHPQTNWSEQNPDEIFDAVIKSIHEVVQTFAPHYPLFISFSAVMHSLIAVDNGGKPLSQCIIWADNRADKSAEKLKNSTKGKEFYHKTGVPIHPMSPLCKILWWKEKEPALFNSTGKFIGIKEYVFYKLFGEFMVDTSVASATGLLNSKTLKWDEEILSFLEIDASRLSKPVSAKKILVYKNSYPGLSFPLGLPFIIGASDGALSNFGACATGNHIMAVNIGTSGAARMLVHQFETDKRMETFCYHFKDDDYLWGGATNNGGVVIKWLKENLLQTNESYEALFDEAKTIAAGSNGLLLLPYILGERAPLWNSDAKGVCFGLTVNHTKAHLLRSAMEGIIFTIYGIGKLLMEKKEIKEIHASGGFVRNALWLQILADVFSKKVIASEVIESPALGAVLLGAEALGIKTEFKNRRTSFYMPDTKNHEAYKKCLGKFERIYNALKEEMGDV